MRRLAAAVLLGLLLAWLTAQTPRPVPADAPAPAFSSGRAMADIRVLGAAPHAQGSARNHQVRDYLTGRMRALGLQTRVQRDRSFIMQGDVSGQMGPILFGGPVENLVGVLPGRDRTAPALALMAHYDAAPGSPGAGDDGAGVAAILETVRALKARGTPARDVVVLLTDGEEQGTLGARAFFQRDPLAAHVGLVVNLEARGGAGRAVMFETSQGDGALIGAFRDLSIAPSASSLANFVYQRMPNGADLTPAKAAGKAGLNFAFVGGQFDYHSPTATPANLDEGSVQSMGGQALAVAERFAFAPTLPPRTGDVVYSQVFGRLLLAYPPWAGWLPIVAALCLIAVAAVRGHRREPLVLANVALGLVAGVLVLGASAALLWLGRTATGVGFGFLEARPLLARFGLWEAAMGLIAAGALTGVFALAGRRGSWLGLLILAAAAAIALQAAQPLVAYAVAWPLLVAALAAALTALGDDRGPATRLSPVVVAALSLGWIGGLAHFTALGLDAPWVLAAFAWLAGLSLWPLLEPLRGRAGAIVATALLVAAAALIGAIRFTSPWSPRFPQATIAYYVADQDSGRFWRAAPAAVFGDWAWRAVSPEGAALQRPPLWPLLARPLATPAPPVTHPAYAVTLTQAADCTVAVSAPWLAGARALNLDLRSAGPVAQASVGGRPARLFAAGGAWTSLYWRGGGVGAAFRPMAPGRVELRYALLLGGWPADAAPLPPRPAAAMAWGDSDALALIGSASLEARACG